MSDDDDLWTWPEHMGFIVAGAAIDIALRDGYFNLTPATADEWWGVDKL